MKKTFLKLSVLGSVLAPLAVFAQQTPGNCVPTNTITNITSFLCRLQGIVNTIIPFLITLGVLYFIWGVVQYVIGDEEKAKEQGRDKMVFGIIGLVVIMSMWGLVYLVSNSFGLTGSSASNINLPCVPGTGC